MSVNKVIWNKGAQAALRGTTHTHTQPGLNCEGTCTAAKKTKQNPKQSFFRAPCPISSDAEQM